MVGAVVVAVVVVAGLVGRGRVTGGLVGRGLVTGGRVTGGLVTGGRVTGGLVTGGRVTGGLVTGGRVTGGLVTGGLVAGGLVGRGRVVGGRVVGGSEATIGDVVGRYVGRGRVGRVVCAPGTEQEFEKGSHTTQWLAVARLWYRKNARADIASAPRRLHRTVLAFRRRVCCLIGTLPRRDIRVRSENRDMFGCSSAESDPRRGRGAAA